MKTVLVGIDRSGTAREALRTAISEAQWRGAQVLALHVVQFPVVMGYGAGLVIAPKDLLENAAAALADEVAGVEAEFPSGSPVTIQQLAVIGHTGVELLAIAESHDYDLVLTVAGSRGLGGFKGLLLGSTTSYLVHHLKSPLLVVPAVKKLEEAA